MNFFIQILQLLGAITLFIFSIKFLSEHLQSLSNTNFKRLINQITATNLSSILFGSVFTVAIQSSSAASVFILSFVNNGVINLKKAFGLILGANIGTTITLLFVLLGLKFNFLILAFPLLLISFPFYLSIKKIYKKIGGVFIGLSLLFISIHFLKEFLPQLDSQTIDYFIYDLKNYSTLTKIIFIILGLFLTILVHFSTASITISLLLIEKGLPIELGLMLVLGANIGTTITAHIVALLGNFQSKIVASFHTFFNIICAILFLFLSSYIINLINLYTLDNAVTIISFDIIVNVIGVALFFPFLNFITKFCENNFKSSKYPSLQLSESFSIKLGNNMDIYRNEANKKISRLASTSRQIMHTLGRMNSESDEEKMNIFRERIFQLEKEGDDLEMEVKEFLNHIQSLDISSENPFYFHQLISLSHHLESIGDIAIKIASIHRKRRITNSYFTPKLREYLFELQNNLDQATTILNQNLSENLSEISLKDAQIIERNINSIYKEAEIQLIKSIEKDKLNTLSALYYKEMIQHYEQLGDHIFRANKTIVKLNEQ